MDSGLKQDRVMDNVPPWKIATVSVRRMLPVKATAPSSRVRRCVKAVRARKVANVNSRGSNRNVARKALAPPVNVVKAKTARSVRPWNANDL
jgi:hypothetical protein